jgi:hypothetical protein
VDRFGWTDSGGQIRVDSFGWTVSGGQIRVDPRSVLSFGIKQQSEDVYFTFLLSHILSETRKWIGIWRSKTHKINGSTILLHISGEIMTKIILVFHLEPVLCASSKVRKSLLGAHMHSYGRRVNDLRTWGKSLSVIWWLWVIKLVRGSTQALHWGAGCE